MQCHLRGGTVRQCHLRRGRAVRQCHLRGGCKAVPSQEILCLCAAYLNSSDSVSYILSSLLGSYDSNQIYKITKLFLLDVKAGFPGWYYGGTLPLQQVPCTHFVISRS